MPKRLESGVKLVTKSVITSSVKNFRDSQSDFSATKSKLKPINNFDYC